MTPFAQLNRECMDLLQDKINPYIREGTIGHLWTARLELAGIIERIETWIATDAQDLFERQQAAELAAFFRSLPEAGYSRRECVDALKQETARWRGR